MKYSNLYAALFFVLFLYTFGAGIGEGFQYASWRLIPPASFPAVHQAVGQMAQLWLLPFVLVTFPVDVLFLCFLPSAMSRVLAVTAVILHLFVTVVTAALAIPLQVKLNNAFAADVLDRLISFHFYLRVLPSLLGLAIAAVLLWQGFGRFQPERTKMAG